MNDPLYQRQVQLRRRLPKMAPLIGLLVVTGVLVMTVVVSVMSALGYWR